MCHSGFSLQHFDNLDKNVYFLLTEVHSLRRDLGQERRPAEVQIHLMMIQQKTSAFTTSGNSSSKFSEVGTEVEGKSHLICCPFVASSICGRTMGRKSRHRVELVQAALTSLWL